MSDVGDTQLPLTATPLAKALDVLEDRLFGLPVEMITKDPWTVDAGVLDHLAWEHSVDVWDVDWPEDVKRRIIAASCEVHRYKGTPFAIKAALAAFDVDSELLEWWQPEGVADAMERGSFRVTAYAGRALYGDTENTIDTRMVFAMNAVVQRVAPVSRKLIFRLGERFETLSFMRAEVRQGCLHEVDHDPAPRPEVVRSGPVVRCGLRAVTVSAQTHDCQPRPAVLRLSQSIRHATRVLTQSTEFHDVQRRTAD